MMQQLSTDQSHRDQLIDEQVKKMLNDAADARSRRMMPPATRPD
jgi:hypothetical protein